MEILFRVGFYEVELVEFLPDVFGFPLLHVNPLGGGEDEVVKEAPLDLGAGSLDGESLLCMGAVGDAGALEGTGGAFGLLGGAYEGTKFHHGLIVGADLFVG